MEKDVNWDEERYVRGYPRWLRFLIFLKSGLYNPGSWEVNRKRLFCWFHRHEYLLYFYDIDVQQVKFEKGQEEKSGFNLGFNLQCDHCGNSRYFRGEYRGHGEHRIEEFRPTKAVPINYYKK